MKNRYAVMGGTSLLSHKSEYYDTAFFFQRHGGHDGHRSYLQPHQIDHKANMMHLKKQGVTHILAIGSVGSLKRDLQPGVFVVPDDFFALSSNPTFFDDERSHRTHGFDADWRTTILNRWHDTTLPPPVAKGVYCQTSGPRFETPAEIRFFQHFGDIVGMTIASECILAGELDIAYAALCIVDNLANGLTETPLSYENFQQQVHANKMTLHNTLAELLPVLFRERS